MKAIALVVLFSAGFLVAGAVTAHGQAGETTTETATTTETLSETTTAPGTTVVTTSTVQQSPTTSPTTTSSSSSSSSTPTWVWVALAALAAIVVGLAVALLTRSRGGGAALPAGERRRRLENAVATWAAQGWALESETADSAVLRRGGEIMVVNVDDAGGVTSRPLAR